MIAAPTTQALVTWRSGTQLYEIRPIVNGVEVIPNLGAWTTR